MGKRIRDISEVPSPTVRIEELLSVRLEKTTILISLLLVGGCMVFLVYEFMIMKKYLIALSALVFISFNLKEMIKYYIMAFELTPYLSIDREGIYHKKKKYFWTEISCIKWERYLTINWERTIHLCLKNDKEILIDLPPQYLDKDDETIIAYLKNYK